MWAGTTRGVRFRFHAGRLRAADLSVQGKAEVRLAEAFGPEVPRIEAVSGPVEERGANWAIATTRVEHDLGVGRRSVEIVQSEETYAGGLTTTAVASLKQVVEVSTAVVWHLVLDDVATVHEDSGGVVVDLAAPTSTVVRVRGDRPIDFERSWDGHRRGQVRLRAVLPAGSSSIELTLSCGPDFDFAEAFVVCRPDQLREAAVVASCLQGSGFVPVIPLEPPPVDEAEYIRLHEEVKAERNRVHARMGGKLGQAEILAADPAERAAFQAEFLAYLAGTERLTPYRSWLKHNEMVSGLLAAAGFARAVFLFEPEPSELRKLDPVLASKASDIWNRYHERVGSDPGPPSGNTMFEGQHGKLYLLGERSDVPGRHHYRDLTDLAALAWRLLRGDDGPPTGAVEVAVGGSSREYLHGLYRALRAGVPILPVADPQTPADIPVPEGDEAVLVEDTGDAATLLAVLYAHHRGAQLVVTPEPSLERVQAAIATQQDRITAATRAHDEGDRGLAEVLRRFLGAGRQGFAEIEEVVTAQVPAKVVAAVGDRRLTAFTTGLPYSFVRTAHADWSRKPIGHVAADPVLIVLNEIYSAAFKRTDAAFGLILDTGYFRTSETADVVRAMEAHATYPLVLNGEEASLSALSQLARQLPLELVFFNTHGYDGGIVLGDMPVRSFEIVQWVSLPQRPIVFNNSCQSWTGVGRDFVRIGARGYVGTLWSVRSDLAADFAIAVMADVTTGATTAAEAITRTGLPDVITRSYLYVGTVNGRLTSRDSEVSGVSRTLTAAGRLVRMTSPDNVVRELVLREVAQLRAAIDSAAEPSLASVDLALDELALLGSASLTASREERAARIADHVDRVLKRWTPATPDVRARQALLHQRAGKVNQAAGKAHDALAQYATSLSHRDEFPESADLRLRMAEILDRLGRRDEAVELARAAERLWREHGDLTQLMDICRFFGRLPEEHVSNSEARRYTDEGHAIAVLLGNEDRQADFKLLESNLHGQAGDFTAAAAAAGEALTAHRLQNNHAGELSAFTHGLLYRYLNGESELGEEDLTVVLNQAKNLGFPVAEALLRCHLGTLLHQHGDSRAAVRQFKEATEQLLAQGAWSALGEVIFRYVEVAEAAGATEDLWTLAVRCTALCGLVDEGWRPDATTSAVRAMQAAIRLGDRELTHGGLGAVWKAVSAVGHRDNGSDHFRFVGDVYVLFLHWVAGEPGDAVRGRARQLDELSGRALELEEFVRVPYEPGARSRLRRWLRR